MNLGKLYFALKEMTEMTGSSERVGKCKYIPEAGRRYNAEKKTVNILLT